MSARTTGRSAGALFLLAYVVYLAGGALARSGSAGTVALPQIAAHQLQVSAGTLLMLANSAAVIGIGILLFPVLRRHHELSAYGYLAAQVVQGLMLAVGVAFLLLRIPLARAYPGSHASVLTALARVAEEANHYSFWIGMISVGIGGLLLCRVLLLEKLSPAFLAVYGLAVVRDLPGRSHAGDPRPQRRRGPVYPRRNLRNSLRSAADRQGLPRRADSRLRRSGPQRPACHDSTVQRANRLMR